MDRDEGPAVVEAATVEEAAAAAIDVAAAAEADADRVVVTANLEDVRAEDTKDVRADLAGAIPDVVIDQS